MLSLRRLAARELDERVDRGARDAERDRADPHREQRRTAGTRRAGSSSGRRTPSRPTRSSGTNSSFIAKSVLPVPHSPDDVPGVEELDLARRARSSCASAARRRRAARLAVADHLAAAHHPVGVLRARAPRPAAVHAEAARLGDRRVPRGANTPPRSASRASRRSRAPSPRASAAPARVPDVAPMKHAPGRRAVGPASVSIARIVSAAAAARARRSASARRCR